MICLGERIKDLAYTKIGNTNFRIELNKGYFEHSKYDIHLQCDKGRMGLSDTEFLKLATCFMLAKKQFLSYKEKKDE